MRKLFAILGAVALALTASYAATQVVFNGSFKEPVYSAVTADDTDVAFIVRYVGSTPSVDDTVTTASGAITFKQNGAADTTLECPVVPALGGIIDTSDAACDTLGEVVDVINASADWEAVILDGLRSDATTTTQLLAAAAADATGKAGLNVYFDTSVALRHTRALVTGRTFKSFFPADSVNGKTIAKPYLGTYSILVSLTAKSTYATGTSDIQVWAVKTARGSEEATLLWTEPGGATTALKTIGASTWPWGLIGIKDTKLVYRVVNSAAAATTTSNAYGVLYLY